MGIPSFPSIGLDVKKELRRRIQDYRRENGGRLQSSRRFRSPFGLGSSRRIFLDYQNFATTFGRSSLPEWNFVKWPKSAKSTGSRLWLVTVKNLHKLSGSTTRTKNNF